MQPAARANLRSEGVMVISVIVVMSGLPGTTYQSATL
jgi:hypothetical protein